MQRYKGSGSLGSAFLLPVHPLVQIVQKQLHIGPPIGESADARASAPLLKRPLVPESGTRALEFHFPTFDQGERFGVRKEAAGGLPGMVNPLLNEGFRLRGDGVAMIRISDVATT